MSVEVVRPERWEQIEFPWPRVEKKLKKKIPLEPKDPWAKIGNRFRLVVSGMMEKDEERACS